MESIRLNRLIESELEAGFLEALHRILEGEPERSLTQHVVNGKQGWYLKIPTYGNWLVEPQVEMGPDKGISVSSRADFVLYPERPKAGERPVAVFTDGYEYHADPISGNMRVALDSAQRLAINRSGKYDVWSVAWSDVYGRLDNRRQGVSPLTGPPGQVFSQVLNQLQLSNPATWVRLYQSSSFDLLLYRLTSGRERAQWNRFSAAVLLNFLNSERRQGAEGNGMINIDDNSKHAPGFPCPVCHVITVRQPFASLIALGLFRHYEYCSRTHYRGRVVIHASKCWHALMLRSLVATHLSKLTDKPEQAVDALFPLGLPVAEASVMDCRPYGKKFAVRLDQVRIVERPKPPLRDASKVPWKFQPAKELAQALSRARVLQGREKDDVYREFGLLALRHAIDSWLKVNGL